jgi:hypothetical protein
MSNLSSETAMLKQQPWHVASWRPVTLALTQRTSIIRRLAPCGSGRLLAQRLERGARGQVMWACDTAQGPVGLAWDWFALRPAVLAMADPMGVLSNLHFVDAHGQPLPDGRRIVELNNVIASLSWQAPIVKSHAAQAAVSPHETALMAA